MTVLLLLAACQKEQVTVSPEEETRRDSLAFHVAVMPVMDCLPIYYAERTGLFEKEGVDVRLQEHMSLMDCDTSLLRGRVEMGYTDVLRTLEMQGDSLPLRVVMGTDGRVSLVTARKGRMRSLKHLNERMVALDRLSTADYWSDELMLKAGLGQAAIYRPQVNDVQLRTMMLMEQLVDAALLPEPYATQAERAGHKRLFEPNDTAPRFNCMVVRKSLRTDSLRSIQMKHFFAAYDKAVKQLNGKADREVLLSILTVEFGLPAEVADSLKLPVFKKVHQTRNGDADRALAWLKSRERKIKQSARDSLFLK
ncbi:MAG: ABC transporter substrate-binding protein [Bacteroidaceae bacterium]|nr:ABC transporter substrate-binding protein [Bacteroidaceae bacterium]